MSEKGYTFSPATSEFFAQRADEAMEQLWADGTWNEQKLRDLENAHYRTPYEQHITQF
ncbi:MAG: hypothetical protein IJK50_12000 [Prevotella sp.]|nr:hypothetical protein [Prevotella sp.]